MRLRHGIIVAFLVVTGIPMTGVCAPAKVNVDTKTRAVTVDDGVNTLDYKGCTLTLGSVTISDSAGIRTIALGSTNGTKIGATGDRIGFLGAAPIARPSSTTDLRLALINLGLYTTGGASPLNLNGGAFTSGTISGTNETLSGTLGVTGNTTLTGTLGITGAATGSSLTLSGNETVGGILNVTGASNLHALAITGNETVSGTFAATGNSTFAGTLGITGALNGSSAAFSGNETVGGTFAASGNSTFGGTIGITGALSGSTFSFSGNSTVGGTFGVTGNFTGSTGTFSGALGSGPFTATTGSFSSTLGITGALTGSSAAFSGNETVGGTFAATGNSTFGGSLGVTGPLSVTGALSGSSGTFSTTLGVTGNTTFGGTLSLTGNMSGSTFSYSGNGTVGGTLGVTGNTTVGGTLNSNGTLSSTAQVANLDFIDASKAPYSVDLTGVTNSTTPLLAAIAAAQAANKDLYIPDGTVAYSTMIALTAKIRIFGDGINAGTKLKWIGTSGATMMTSTNVDRGGGLENITLDGNSLAANGIILDGSCTGFYKNVRIIGITTGTGLRMIATTHTCSWNIFQALNIEVTTDGNSLIWMSSNGAGSACHNTFLNTALTHGGTRPGIRLGACDNDQFHDTWIFRVSGSAAGVLVDPTELSGFPSANVFTALQAGDGGWVQPGSVTVDPAEIYGYQKDNGQPDPVTNNTALGPVTYSDGRIEALALKIIAQTPLLELQNRNTTAIQGVNVLASDYGTSAKSALFALGDSAATGTVGGITWANTGAFRFTNLAHVVFATNNGTAIQFSPADTPGLSLTAGLAAQTGNITATGTIAAGGTITATGGFIPATSTGTAVFHEDASAGSSLTVANNATGNPFGGSTSANFAGKFLIVDPSVSGSVAEFLVGGGGIVMLGQTQSTGANFTTTANSATHTNVYLNGSNAVEIQNKSGSSCSYRIVATRIRTTP